MRVSRSFLPGPSCLVSPMGCLGKLNFGFAALGGEKTKGLRHLLVSPRDSEGFHELPRAASSSRGELG